MGCIRKTIARVVGVNGVARLNLKRMRGASKLLITVKEFANLFGRVFV